MDRIILTSVKIKCLQAQLGCDWQGDLSSVEVRTSMFLTVSPEKYPSWNHLQVLVCVFH